MKEFILTKLTKFLEVFNTNNFIWYDSNLIFTTAIFSVENNNYEALFTKISNKTKSYSLSFYLKNKDNTITLSLINDTKKVYKVFSNIKNIVIDFIKNRPIDFIGFTTTDLVRVNLYLNFLNYLQNNLLLNYKINYERYKNGFIFYIYDKEMIDLKELDSNKLLLCNQINKKHKQS